MTHPAAERAALDQGRAVKTAGRSQRVTQACRLLEELRLPYSPAHVVKVAKRYEADARRGEPVGDWLGYVDRLLHSGNPFVGRPHPGARLRGGAA